MDLTKNTVQKIHDTPYSGVFVITGGGLGMLNNILSVPGASRTVLEGIVPYSTKSMEQFLGFMPEKFSCEETARKMAMAAYRKAIYYGGNFGLSITAALNTDREKKGKCKAYVGYQDDDRTIAWYYELNPEHSREKQEKKVSDFVLECLRHTLFSEAFVNPLRYVMNGSNACIMPKGKITAILPGSFNPMQSGHISMQQDASKRLGTKVLFELCINNVDKGYIDYIDIKDRLNNVPSEYNQKEDFVYTNAPLIIDKARAFNNGITFVVGIDTLIRFLDVKYYKPDSARNEIFDELIYRGCNFLVYGRKIADEFVTIDDIILPDKIKNICEFVGEENFRLDISSTGIRNEI